MALLIPILFFIGLSIGLAWYFIAHDHGEKEPVGALWAATGFGLLAAVAAGFIENWLVPINPNDTATQATSTLFLAMLGVGAIEEICKFVPLALFLYKKRYFNEHTDGIIYFALAGLGFGLPENILYSIGFGLKASVARLVLTPFFHSAITAMVGYFLIKAKLDGKPKWTVGLALLGAIILHGMYDFGLSVGVNVFVVVSLMITFGMAAMLFVLYMRAGELDRAQGLSAAGKNSFCRYCGTPNPHHLLYCTHCGRRA